MGLKPLPVVAMHLALGFCSVGLWKWGRNRVDLGVPAAEGLPPAGKIGRGHSAEGHIRRGEGNPKVCVT